MMTSVNRQRITTGSSFEEQIGYSRAVVAGDTIYVSGTTGYDYATMTISDDIAEQADQCLRTIDAALREAGSSIDDAVRVTYLVTDGAEFERCKPVLRRWFSTALPAATMMVVALMDEAMKIEIEVTAVRSTS